jgi:ribose 5-phosphate isomerase B
MKIYLATDHAGYELKEKVKIFVLTNGHETIDWGNYRYAPDDDYPDYIGLAAKALSDDVAQQIESRAIIFGGSGQGEAIVANRYPGVRATVYYGDGIRVVDDKTYDIIALAREHNDSNCLSIGARFVNPNTILTAINQWLATPFSGDERHVRRIAQIETPITATSDE